MVVNAQENPHSLPYFDFIKYDSNRIVFPGDSLPMRVFYERLDRLIFEGEGQIDILHLGGSHIQADVFSGQMRRELQELAPGLKAGRGLVFPFNLARTNNPRNYKTEYTGEWKGCRSVEKKKNCNLGLTGMSATTRDTLTHIKMYSADPDYLSYDFNKVKVFHTVDENSFTILADSSILLATRIDSEGGFTELTFPQHLDTLEFSIVKTAEEQSSFTLFGVKFENDDPGISYHAVGVNGADVPAYLRYPQLAKHLRSVDPDLIILSIGINDAYYPSFRVGKYKENYRELIGRIQEVSPNAAIVFTSNNDSYFKKRYANLNGKKVVTAMQELAMEYRAGFWNMFEIMGGFDSMPWWEYEGLARTDKIHFTRAGYTLLGDLFFSALVKSYDQHIRESIK